MGGLQVDYFESYGSDVCIQVDDQHERDASFIRLYNVAYVF